MKARWEIDLSPGGRKRPLSACPRTARKGLASAGWDKGTDTRRLAFSRLPRRGGGALVSSAQAPVDGRGNRIDRRNRAD